MQFRYKDRRFRIENIDGTIWGIIGCERNGRYADVARISEFGEKQSRYIEAGPYGIWQCILPGESYRDKYGYNYEGYTRPFTKAYQSLEGLFDTQELSEKDFAVILEKYPEFKWVKAKAKFNGASAFLKILDIWRNNAQTVETLLSLDCSHIALNLNFYKATNQKEIIKYLSQHPAHKYNDLDRIRMAIKYKTDIHEIEDYKDCVYPGHHVSFEEWCYLLKTDKCKRYGIHQTISIYIDYKKMAERAGHKLSDPYWHYPKHLAKQHNKVQKEVQAIIKAEQAIREAEAAKEKAAKERKLQNVYTKFATMMQKLNGMSIENGKLKAYIPQDVETVRTQATKLHQCLIANNYISNVVKKKCLLVFIAKNGKPFATAELIKRKGKYFVNQFYGNQAGSRNSWEAKPEAHNILNLFISKNKLPMAKANAA